MFEQEKKAHLSPLQQFLENPLSWIIPEFTNINNISRDNQCCWSLTTNVRKNFCPFTPSNSGWHCYIDIQKFETSKLWIKFQLSNVKPCLVTESRRTFLSLPFCSSLIRSEKRRENSIVHILSFGRTCGTSSRSDIAFEAASVAEKCFCIAGSTKM